MFYFQNTVGPHLPHFLGGHILLAALSMADHGGRPHEVLRQGDDPPIGGGSRGKARQVGQGMYF